MQDCCSIRNEICCVIHTCVMAFSSASVNSFPSGLETVPTQCVGMRADTLPNDRKKKTKLPIRE